MTVEPVILEGPYVRLEPLSLSHLPGLVEVGLDPDLWRWTTTCLASAEDVRRYIETALHEQREGRSAPFATIDLRSGRVIGSTRYGNIDLRDRHVEIGWTWIARPWQDDSILFRPQDGRPAEIGK